MLSDEILSVVNVTHRYNEREIPALSDISFTLRKGEMLAVTGASGAGKSTLLKIAGTFLKPTAGDVKFEGGILPYALSQSRFQKFRREQIGFVEQDFALIDVLTAGENIMLAMQLEGCVNHRFLFDVTSHLGLDKCLDRYPYELSRGEQQRVAIARAVAKKPCLLIADEPTANLDRSNGEKVEELLWEINLRYGQTVIFATHDKSFADRATKRLTLSDGVAVLSTNRKANGR